MCGLVGIIASQTANLKTLEEDVRRFVVDLQHRGPDDDGVLVDAAGRVILGHARLAIQDLSELGHQPMVSPTGRFVIAYNGEIYNHFDLRRDLDAMRDVGWLGSSDTETLLAAFETWGVGATLRQMSGMFAFALLDRKENALYLARDRMGEKPLYFGKYGENVFFSSELKPILKSGSQQFIVEQASLAEHLVQGFIQAPKSILQNVSKVVPGTVLKFNLADLHAGPETETYWSICELASRENDALRQNSQQECTDLVHDELRRAVAGQLLSDVGLGTFLSGGIDSSLISALAAETSDRKLDSFTIGFEERSLDESKYASTVSAHLGLNHNELMMADSDLLAVVPELAEIYDEPFGDSSQIPTVALSKFARSKVTVALSGDGADELFGGYNRHTVGANLWKRARSLHKLGRWPMRSFLNILSEADFRRVYQLSAGLGFERRLPPDINQKIRKLANVLGAEDELAFYQSLRYHEHGQKCLHDPAFVTLKNQKTLQGLFSEYAMEDAMMLADMIQYLPDDIFTKVDRASMFHSLETRAPFCDPRVVTLALGLPTSRKIKSGTGKLILREILSRYVPSKMFERPKSGFAVPLAQWLRGALAPWAESVLNEELVEHEHIFDYGFISGAWASFRQGRQSEVWWLWNLITFLAWLRNYKSRVSL